MNIFGERLEVMIWRKLPEGAIRRCGTADNQFVYEIPSWITPQNIISSGISDDGKLTIEFDSTPRTSNDDTDPMQISFFTTFDEEKL
jgi:hypothetical protein